MKQFFFISGILVATAFLLSSFSIRENPQDPPRGKKKERHIKLVKVENNGNKLELDTVLTNDGIFVWNGDTIGGNGMTWFSEGDFELDSVLQGFDFDIKNEGDDNVFVMKSGKGAPKIYEFKSDGDSTLEYRIEVRKDEFDDENHMVFAPRIPGVPPVPPVPGLHFFDNGSSENIIDLSDPEIISFKKKKMRGGREKITIVRNEPDEKDGDKVKEIIINSNLNSKGLGIAMPEVHKIVVTKNDDGTTEISQDEKVLHLQGGNETVKVIQENGKVIRITEKKEGDKKNIEVEVEESQENN